MQLHSPGPKYTQHRKPQGRGCQIQVPASASGHFGLAKRMAVSIASCGDYSQEQYKFESTWHADRAALTDQAARPALGSCKQVSSARPATGPLAR